MTEIWLAIISAVATIAVAAISAWGTIAIRKLSQKTGVEIDEIQERRIIEHAVNAVRYAEEVARRALTEEGESMSGNQKLELAKRFLERRLKDGGIRIPGDLDGLIEAILNGERHGEEGDL